MQEKEALIDIFDAKGKVIGQKTRARVNKKTDILKSAYVMVMNDEYQLLLTRSSTDTLYPNTWGSSAAGLVRQGESFEDAAKRTLARELEIVSALDSLGEEFNDFNGVKRFMGMFIARTNVKPTLNPRDAQESVWVALNEAERLMNKGECMPMVKPVLKAVREWLH